MSVKVKFVIADVNMGAGHNGLNLIIEAHKKKNKLFAQSIKDGGLILFINSKRNRAKLYEKGGAVLGYLKLHGRRLTEKSIDSIPQTFGGSVSYSTAVKSAFKKFLEEEEAQMAARTHQTILHA